MIEDGVQRARTCSFYTRIGSNRGNPQSTSMYRKLNILTHSKGTAAPSRKSFPAHFAKDGSTLRKGWNTTRSHMYFSSLYFQAFWAAHAHTYRYMHKGTSVCSQVVAETLISAMSDSCIATAPGLLPYHHQILGRCKRWSRTYEPNK